MYLIKKIMLSLAFLVSATLLLSSKSYSASSYGMSCTNEAYGTQHGLAAYNDAGANSLGGGNIYGVAGYTGTDCVYAGAGLTNSVAIVSGEVARAAANAIVGSINNRIAMAMNANTDAAHMSYTTNGGGIGMSANGAIGGASVWMNYTDSSFENDQAFVALSRDTNQYDGDASAFSFGVDKKFGNMLVGITGTDFDADIDTTANSGSLKADGRTYGVYVGLNTGALRFVAGYGMGSYDVDTNRLDLGTGNTTITGTTEADISYGHLAVMGSIVRGKIAVSPRLAYQTIDFDTDAFTDIVPNDANTVAPDTLTTADVAIAGFNASSDILSLGVNIARSTGGALTPYIDLAYGSDDTTVASYNTEINTDGVEDQTASDGSNFFTVGAGLNLSLRGKLSGNLSMVETMNREDYKERTISATIKLSF